MVAFGDVARRMIGKPVQQLLRTSTSANVYPPEITRLVSLRFTFAITMTRQSYYKAQKTYNVAALVTSHGQPVAIPDNAAHGDGGNESAAESGDSSDKSGGQDARSQSTAATPDSTQASPGLLSTPPPSLASLATPVTRKHQRSESSKTGKHPSCRRRILEEADDADAIGADIPASSATADKINTAQGDNSSEDHSSAQESG